MDNRPNILFICSDQQRWDTLGPNKPANLRVPNMDQLVSEGAHLTHAFCQSPVCVPSRACMLSGQYADQTGLFHNRAKLPSGKITWPRVLQEKGYETVAVGRSHSITEGFRRHVAVPISDSYMEHQQDLNQPKVRWSYGHENYLHRPHIYEGDFEDYIETRIATTANHMMRDLCDSQKPWAMYVGFLIPHNPYILPRQYADFYADEDFDEPIVFPEDGDKPCCGKKGQDYWAMFSEKNVRQTRRYYYTMVSMYDELVGRLLAKLEELGQKENTLVMMTSDHGEMNGDHSLWAKSVFYDESVRIPLVARWPGHIPAGRTCDAFVEQVDYMPTLLEAAGLASPDSVAGKSFSDLLTGKTQTHKEVTFSDIEQYGMRITSMRTRTRRLTYGYPTENGRTGELYDLTSDPAQRYNLFDDSNSRKTRDQLMMQLMHFMLDERHELQRDRPDLVFDMPISYNFY